MNDCKCKRCTAGQSHAPFDATGLERLMDLLYPAVFPSKPRRLRSYDRQLPERCSTVVPLRRYGGNTRQPWEPRPARAA